MYHFFTKHKMCNLIQLLCLLLAFGFTSSWDIAVSTQHEIHLLSKDGSLQNKIEGQYLDLRSVSYDSVRDVLFFADYQHNDSIFALQFGCKGVIDQVVKRQPDDNIQEMVFEPVTNTLFWTNNIKQHGQIHRIPLENGLIDPKMDVMFRSDSTIRGIAVDSCNGYLYWTNSDHTNPSIQRSKLDNFKPETIITSKPHMPLSIVVDQSSSKLYWITVDVGNSYYIESADLNGKNRNSVYNGTHNSGVVSIAVDGEYIYWIDSLSQKVWKYPKNSTATEPTLVKHFENDMSPKGIATKINILSQIEGKNQCKNFRDSMENDSLGNSLRKFGTEQKFCLNIVNGSNCQLSSQSCDPCSNYCIHGTCSSLQGAPICSCEVGFGGSRCELSCHNGDCCVPLKNGLPCQKISPVAQPECLCSVNSTQPKESNKDNSEYKSDTIVLESKDEQNLSRDSVDDFIRNDSTESAPEQNSFCLQAAVQLSHPLVMALLALCGCLSLMCAVLAAKVLQLKKRPRIKKRYIVNKNVTPLTCRPEAGQCEITIENCCNMNICETPCFEPQGLRSSSVPSGKEEKKNLIAHMEHPDDLY